MLIHLADVATVLIYLGIVSYIGVNLRTLGPFFFADLFPPIINVFKHVFVILHSFVRVLDLILSHLVHSHRSALVFLLFLLVIVIFYQFIEFFSIFFLLKTPFKQLVHLIFFLLCDLYLVLSYFFKHRVFAFIFSKSRSSMVNRISQS